mmetsp:Transcript_106189/g.226678  ORF Transcript_106189/g.226678 Transcript_106189/m.226678 type:complete len:214 (+) Transcript_106189:709-1350(+)
MERMVAEKDTAWREVHAIEAAGVDGGSVAHDPTTRVAIRHVPNVLFGVHDTVDREIRIEADHLHAVVAILQDLAIGKNSCTLLETLHLATDYLCLTIILADKEDVADTPTSELLDVCDRAIFVGDHGKELPWIPIEKIIHGLHSVQAHSPRWRASGLIHPPTDRPRQHKIEVARNNVALRSSGLTEGAHILVCEGAHADHQSILALYFGVVEF